MYDGYIPSFICITKAAMHENKVAQCLNVPANSIITLDRGYNNYKWFSKLEEKNMKTYMIIACYLLCVSRTAMTISIHFSH